MGLSKHWAKNHGSKAHLTHSHVQSLAGMSQDVFAYGMPALTDMISKYYLKSAVPKVQHCSGTSCYPMETQWFWDGDKAGAHLCVEQAGSQWEGKPHVPVSQ